MYILVRESLPPGMAIVAAAHASLAAYLRFQDMPEVAEWVDPGPFRKVVCAVDDGEFEAAKRVDLGCGRDDRLVLTESALDGQETAIAFMPRRDWPAAFRLYRLWGA